MHGVPSSWDCLSAGSFESVYSWFDDSNDLVWSFPIRAELSGVGFFGVFEDFSHDQITELKRARADLFVVVALDLILVILDPKEGFVAFLF